MNRLPVRTGIRTERGNALIEFALGAVVLFLLLCGILDFSRAIWHYNILAGAAREGARYAIVRGSESGFAVSASDVQTYVQARAFNLNPTVAVSWTPNNQPGSIVQVQAQHTFTSMMPILPVGSIPLSATARMTVLR